MVRTSFALALAGLLVGPSLVFAQPPHDPLQPASTGGIAVIDQALARLSGHRRLLVMGAHPDDEDSTLLTLVARGLGGEAAYLSLNRGEGGQNLIGPELGIGLGLIRFQELVTARGIDGARQYFTRAYDFGYTRSVDETFRRWPRSMLEEDVLRVIRRFRPQVIVSVFPPTARAGHGQHQVAGVLAAELFSRAGDTEMAPGLEREGLFPWQPQALYRSGFFDRESEALEIPLGIVDPLDGRSLLQLARASRSSHRSQDMGSLQEPGSRNNRLIPVGGKATTEGDNPFAGIDTRLAAMAEVLGADPRRVIVEAHLEKVEKLARAARRGLSPSNLGSSREKLASIVAELKSCRQALGAVAPASAASAVAALIEEKWQLAQEALIAASGLVPDAFTDRGLWVPGEKGKVTARLWNSSDESVLVRRAELRLAEGWQARLLEAQEFPLELEAGALKDWQYEVTPPDDAEPSWPYFLRRQRQGDLYDWTGVDADVKGTPFQGPFLSLDLAVVVAGQEAALVREVVHRYAEQAVGEIRQPLRLVPRLEVSVEPKLVVLPIGAGALPPVEVRLINHGEESVQGEVRVSTPPGWPALSPVAFTLAGQEGRSVFQIPLVPPSGLEAGEYAFAIEAAVENVRFRRSAPVVDYPHIRVTQRPEEARLVVRAGDLRLPSLGRVGYVRGAADRVPEALRQVGVPVEILSAETLAVGELAAYDTIVIGSRAYEIDDILIQANERLLDYVRGGGTLVVQYQQYQFTRGEYAPFPLEIGRPHGRVTDETAPVEILRPNHPIFHHPNLLSAEDWDSWIQERGLYFPGVWDDAYIPLLAMADPGGEKQRGSLLVAQLGEGTYVYTGLAFFRQLPAGVTGAYRLFLNILALGHGGSHSS